MKKYQIIPKKQIGLFTLNSYINDNKDLENIYGNISYKGSLNLKSESFDKLKESYAKYGLDTSKFDEIKKFYFDHQKDIIYQILYNCGIDLVYKNENLVEITVHKECENLNFNGHYLFKESPKDIIDLFCDTLQEYPLIKKQDIYFPKNHMTLWAFSEDVTSDGKVVWANERSEFYSEKSFAMYAGPRNDDQTYDDYIVYKPALLK